MTNQDETSNEPTDSQAENRSSVTPALDLLVDEHEEEVSENGKTVRRQGIYLLPNLFTTGGLFAGFYAIIAAFRGDF
jgi:CDP-diacylglycerol--serine O-phosphatidyltransferase